MSKCYTYIQSGLTLTEEQLVNRIKEEIDKHPEKYEEIISQILSSDIQDNTYSQLILIDEKGRKAVNTGDFESVSNYIEEVHDKLGLLVPEYREDSRIRNYILNLNPDEVPNFADVTDAEFRQYVEALAREEITSDEATDLKVAAQEIFEQLRDEELGKQLGTEIHGLLETLFKYGPTSTKWKNAKAELAHTLINTKQGTKTLFELITANTETDHSVEEIANSIANKVKQDVYAKILGDRRFQNEKGEFTGKVLTELNMSTTNAQISSRYRGVAGRADLVIVSEDGTVYIYDYKVSNRDYVNWYKAKEYHTDYQLGFYRQILAANGIDPNKIVLITKPIYFPKGDILYLTAEKDQIRSNATVSSTPPHLDYQNGKFSENIRQLIKIPIIYTETKSSELSEKIDTNLSYIINTYKHKKTINRQKLIDSIKQYSDKSGKPFFGIFDVLRGKLIKANSKSELIKEGGLIDDYISRLNTYNNSIVQTLIEEVEDYKHKKSSEQIEQKEMDFLGSESSPNPKKPLILQNVFGQYTSSEWELLPFPELIDKNIIGYYNTTNHTVEFTYLTKEGLDDNEGINGRSTILGSFLSNDEVRRISGVIIPEATTEYIGYIKILNAVNTIIEAHPDTFKQYKLLKLRVINPIYGELRIADLKQMTSVYSILTNHAKQKNNIGSEQLTIADPWEAIGSEFILLSKNLSEDSKLRKVLLGIDYNQINKADKIKQLTYLVKKLRDVYPHLKSINVQTAITADLNSDEERVYYLATQMINYYHGIPINYDGKLSKWGLHYEELLRLLAIPFQDNQSNVLKNGYSSKGFLGGMEIDTPQSVPSHTLRALYKYYDAAYLKVRHDYLKQYNQIKSISDPFTSRETTLLGTLLLDARRSAWEKMYVKTADGKLDPRLLLKDPDHSDLSSEDAETLREILWEINKYRISGLPDQMISWDYKSHKHEIESNQKVIQYKAEGRYFETPLRKASSFSRLKNSKKIGLSNLHTKYLEEAKNLFDTRELHSSRAKQIDTQESDSLKMYNAYDISPTERNKYLESEGVYDFEIDLDYLAADVAFQHIRKKYFEEVLLLTECVAVGLKFMSANSNINVDAELEAMANQRKISITNEAITEKELEESGEVVSALKRLNSFVVLAFRPLQFIKELTYGQLTNYSRAWALKYSSSKISAKSVFNANRIIWGQSLKKYGKAFAGQQSLADFTLCEMLNKEYGIANEDLNRIVANSTQSHLSVLDSFSKWMYIANSAPDYYNRLTLFIAKMIEDDCFDAHTLDDKGNLVYDFSKDGRFKTLNKYGLNSDTNNEEYKKEKGLYLAMVDEFENEGISCKTWDQKNGKWIYKPLPKAYTTSQKASIKEVADLAYGFYDHEAKSQINHKFIGLMWMQFMTFWTAKTKLWLRGRPKSQGDNTAQGRFVPRKVNGKQMYKKILVDSDNNFIGTESIPEDQLTPEEKRLYDLEYEWQGDYVEGLLYSITGTLHDIFHADWDHLKNDKVQLANLKLALHDILMGIILYTILKWIFTGGTNRLQDSDPAARTLLRAMQDVGPQSITSLSFEPGFVRTLDGLKQDGLKLLSTDKQFLDLMDSRISMFKDFSITQE